MALADDGIHRAGKVDVKYQVGFVERAPDHRDGDRLVGLSMIKGDCPVCAVIIRAGFGRPIRRGEIHVHRLAADRREGDGEQEIGCARAAVGIRGIVDGKKRQGVCVQDRSRARVDRVVQE